MKYRKFMEESKVTEWDSQYLNYKEGKKRVKEICNAIPTSQRVSNKQFNPISTLLRRKTGFQKIKDEFDEDEREEAATAKASAKASAKVSAKASAKVSAKASAKGPDGRQVKKNKTFANSPISPIMKRMTGFPGASKSKKQPVYHDTTEALATADKEFTEWLLKELVKIEAFYKLKEDEALNRFRALEEQLMLMQRNVDKSSYSVGYGGIEIVLRKRGDDAIEMEDVPRSVKFREQRADYERGQKYRKPINKPVDQAVRRLLKHACNEYYRRLELLRSYIAINREGFRKITKKFDKLSGSGMSGKFMNNHIMRSYFAGAENELDHLINGTELLVAKFFYGNDRRKAALHLRTRGNKSEHHSSFLRSGIYLGMAFVIGDYSAWEAVVQMYDTGNNILAERTKFVMKLWAGIALILLQALLFAFNLRVWARNKINYAFIFEFDPRYHLNHRQFLEIPAFLILIFSVCLWFSIHDFWPGRLDMIHFPLIYIGFVGVILFNPFPILFGPARMYFLTTLWRLAMSGFYNVEFKDFWLGDMASSQGYALSQIYLFFCLYTKAWDKPGTCSTDSVQLWGILGALPAYWRLIQCIRRWRDSGSWFPHLLNGVKYLSVMAYYALMNLWRTDKGSHLYRGLFVSAAVLSSCIGCFWDIVMDWSLLNPYAKHKFLRNELFFKKARVYYVAIVADVLLRFTWVLYIALAHEKAFSPLISFFVAFGEVFRRFIWCFFRMENEHKGNVEAMRAYRDPKLPYRFKDSGPPPPVTPVTEEAQQPLLGEGDNPDVESSLPKRNATLHRLGRTLTKAHRADYERKRVKVEDDHDDHDEEHLNSSDSHDHDSDSDSEDYHPHKGRHHKSSHHKSHHSSRRHGKTRDDSHHKSNPEGNSSSSSGSEYSDQDGNSSSDEQESGDNARLKPNDGRH